MKLQGVPTSLPSHLPSSWGAVQEDALPGCQQTSEIPAEKASCQVRIVSSTAFKSRSPQSAADRRMSSGLPGRREEDPDFTFWATHEEKSALNSRF
jgi:hypothetical protein